MHQDGHDMPEQIVEKSTPVNSSRRQFFHTCAGAIGASALMGMLPEQLRSTAWAGGSDAPEMKEVKIGFIPLTDCAPIAVAAQMGFDRKYGIRIIPAKEASWAGIRDKLANGELQCAHALYGLIYGVQLGIGGQKKDMAVLMTLNHNGQGITLSDQLRQQGVTSGDTLKRLLDRQERRYTFAQTFPTGTHAMWLYYWLAAHDIHPFRDVKTIVVPPPQMVANMRIGNMDGYCVGEPWNARAIHDKVGFSVAASQDIWANHPEKVLACTAGFATKNPHTARAVIMALLEACRYIDVSANRAKVARLIAGKAFVNAPEAIIEGRFAGRYENGIGQKWQDPNYIRFFNDGSVPFPYLSDGMWFLTQHKRWGLLKQEPDYLAVAQKVNQIGLYTEAATQLGINVPKDTMRTSKLMDGRIWDGKDPQTYAAGFTIKA